MNEKLKNCPFCGKEAQLKEQNNMGNKLKAFNGYSWKVVCLSRNCYLKDILDFGHDTKEYAIKSWNNRELNKLDEVKLSNVIEENIVYKAEGWKKLQKAIMSTFGFKTRD